MVWTNAKVQNHLYTSNTGFGVLKQKSHRCNGEEIYFLKIKSCTASMTLNRVLNERTMKERMGIMDLILMG